MKSCESQSRLFQVFRFFHRWRNQMMFFMISVLVMGNIQCSYHLNQPLMGQKGWPDSQSDLQMDPSLHTGSFPNGFRYILKENQTPRDRVSMHLYVQAGSLCERDDEQGIAHFLEHMLFDGSTHFGPGELVKFFQRIGMQFGPDANAQTGFTQTVYDINLPKGDADSISEGLLVLQDYAQGALLLQDQADRERNVVLAEMRSRDSAEYRVLKESFQFEMPGSLIPQRFPIGQKEILEQINAKELRRFYETWYRPERMVLIMVGDFDSTHVTPLIRDAFGGLHAKRPPKSPPTLGRFKHEGPSTFYRYESEIGNTSVRIETIEQKFWRGDSIAWQHEQLLQDLADRIVKQRLDELLQKAKADFSEADISSGIYLKHIRYAEVSAECEPQYWKRTLSTLEQELRRALLFGFSQAEVDQVKKAYLAELQRDVEESNTRDSVDLARQIMGALGSWQVFQSPRQRLDLLGPMAEGATADDLHDAFRKSWKAPHRLVLVTGNAVLPEELSSPQAQIISAYKESSNVAVSPIPEKKPLAFPYLPEPPQDGTITSKEHLADIDVTRISFSNGVRLILKPTSFKANQVLMALSFGGGQASEPEDMPGLARFSQAVVNASGFGRMDQTDLETALAGRVARIHLDVGEDRFVVQGETLSNELPLLVQLLYTFMQDPGFRPEARTLELRRYEQSYRSMAHTVEGAMRMQGMRFLAGGDSRFGSVDPVQLQHCTLDRMRHWFGEQLGRSPLELAVVGDVEPQNVIKIVGRYFASLPHREESIPGPQRPAPVFPAGQTLNVKVDSTIPKSMVVIAYPTDDFWDIGQTRRLNIMADVYTDRLREHIREKLGAAYSPFAYNRAYRAYPGFGIFQVYLTIAPQQALTLIDEVKKISAELIQNGISNDEFRRALDPTLTGIKDLRQTNTYWLNSVLVGASQHPQQLEWARTIEKDYAAISAADVSSLTRRYLKNDQAAVVVITPETNP
jgi:zinc protease